MSQQLTTSTSTSHPSRQISHAYNRNDPYFSRIPHDLLERVILPLAGNPCGARQSSLKLKTCTLIAAYKKQLISWMREPAFLQAIQRICAIFPEDYSHIAEGIQKNRPDLIPSDALSLQQCLRLAIYTSRVSIPFQKDFSFYYLFYLVVKSLPSNEMPRTFQEWCSQKTSTSYYPPIEDLSQRCSSIRKWFSENPEILTQIKELDFSKFLTSTALIPPEIGACVNLETLTSKYVKVLALPETFSRLQNLKRVDLSDSEFTTIPEVLFRLHSLDLVDLSRNKITALPPGDFNVEGRRVVTATLDREAPRNALKIILTGTPFAIEWIYRND